MIEFKMKFILYSGGDGLVQNILYLQYNVCLYIIIYKMKYTCICIQSGCLSLDYLVFISLGIHIIRSQSVSINMKRIWS